MTNYHLGREEVYKASPRIWSFKSTDDIVNGINLRLSNMAGGFPFECGGRTWTDSERLYLCGEWSDDTEEHCRIQERLLIYPSGYAAKRFGKGKFKKSVRRDFAEFRLQWMLFVVWQKCKGNKDFRKLLLQVPQDVTLVENTTSDNWGSRGIWGCGNKELVAARKELAKRLTAENAHMKKKDLACLINIEANKLNGIGVWQGQNNIGKILMLCRDCIVEYSEPQIDYELLRDANIHILGQRYSFNQKAD